METLGLLFMWVICIGGGLLAGLMYEMVASIAFYDGPVATRVGYYAGVLFFGAMALDYSLRGAW